MAQDDVTNPAPLKGGRQRANHIQVHRIELGLTERKMLKQSFAWTVGPPMLAIILAGVGTGLAGFALYQWLKDGPFSDILSPDWRDANLKVWSPEQREIYREANPTLWSQIFDGPAIAWQSIFNN